LWSGTKHSRSANNLLSLNFKTSPLARAADKLTKDSACTDFRQQGLRRAATREASREIWHPYFMLFEAVFYDP
jgi:hypothetical protein